MVEAGGAAATVGAERAVATAQGKAPADRAAAMVQERAVAAARAGTEREAAATARVGAESAAAMGFAVVAADVDQNGLWPLPAQEAHRTSSRNVDFRGKLMPDMDGCEVRLYDPCARVRL